MSYLRANGIGVAEPIRHLAGGWVAAVPGEKEFLAVVFAKAPGEPLSEEGPSESLAETWGAHLGGMHRLVKDYRPSPGIQARRHWEHDDALQMAMRGLEKADTVPYLRLHEA